MHDIAIIGGGPAGLSAALILGRCRRSVVVLDSGHPRNGASRGLHGFLTRDGENPHALRRLGLEQLRPYPTVECHPGTVAAVHQREGRFALELEGGEHFTSRMVLFATGRDDILPEKPGFRELLGRGVYHCPLCDGWEHRDQLLVLYSPSPAVELALELLTWSDDIVVCTDGSGEWQDADRAALARRKIQLVDSPLTRLEGDEHLRCIHFLDAPPLPCAAVFFCGDCTQKSTLPASLGCVLDEDGGVACEGHAATNVPGVYVAGNVRGGLHLAIVAAAEGAAAAVAINDALIAAEIFPQRGSA